MDFIDYYGLFNLSQQANPQQIRTAFLTYLADYLPQGEAYQKVTDAYNTLRNRYKRARYDAMYGYLLMLDVEVRPYPNAALYQLLDTHTYLTLKNIIEKFKTMTKVQYEMDTVEAQAARFNYQIMDQVEPSRLLLRFPRENDRQRFISQLLKEKLIRECN